MGENINPYDLIEVQLGNDTVSARPVEWDGEAVKADGTTADGSYIKPVKYHTTCSNCAQLIEFEPGYISIECEACGHGEFVSGEIEDPLQDAGEDHVNLEDEIEEDAEEEAGEEAEEEAEDEGDDKDLLKDLGIDE